jgi:hypothetical protein
VERSLIAALLTLTGTLIAGFLSTFLAEDYRRFRDRASFAGAIAGELASYNEAWPMLEELLPKLINAANNQNKLTIPRIEKPTDRVFDNCVAQIGLLGPELAEDVAYVYNNINAFRVSFISSSAPDLSSLQIAATLQGGLDAMNRAKIRGEQLPKKLRELASEKYFYKFRFIFISIFVFPAILIGAFILGFDYGKDTANDQDIQKGLAFEWSSNLNYKPEPIQGFCSNNPYLELSLFLPRNKYLQLE